MSQRHGYCSSRIICVRVLSSAFFFSFSALCIRSCVNSCGDFGDLTDLLHQLLESLRAFGGLEVFFFLAI